MPNSVDTNLVTSSAVPHPNRSRSGRREFARLLWKELLALRTFAGLVAVVLSVTCGVLWAWRPEISEEASLILLSLPQLVAIVFAIGSGALLFSQEDEAGTIDFLRGMGVSPRRLVNAKLTAGLACLILLVSGTTVIGWQPPSAPEMSTGKVAISVMSCGAGLVVLLWTSLWSMAIRRELPTVCCGLLGALLLKPFVERWDEIGLLVLFGVLASGLWLLCLVAGSRWMGTGGWWWRINGGATASDDPLELARDGTSALPNLLVGKHRTIPIAAGCTIVVGVALGLLLMMWWPQYGQAGGWPETLEIVWSMILGSVLGWLPVRLELREAQPRNPATFRDWRLTLATGPIAWLLLWWLLSFGLMCAYRSEISLATLSWMWRFFGDEVLPWSLLAFGSFRLMARLCSCRWLAWPLSVLPLGVGWCVWWLLVMLGEPAWLGLSMIGALFTGVSWWQWQVTQRGGPVWRANLYSAGGTIGCLVLFWGLLNWWRVAAIPLDWTGGQQPTALDPLPVPSDNQRAELQSELVALASSIQPAPMVPSKDGREFACYQSDWGVIDGYRDWNQISEPTEAWMERNASAIPHLLHLSRPDRRRLLRQWLFAAVSQQPASPSEKVASPQPLAPPARLSVDVWFYCVLAAKRCEATEQLDDAMRLWDLSKSLYLLFDKGPRIRDGYWDLLLRIDGAGSLAAWINHPGQSSSRLKEFLQEWPRDWADLPPLEDSLNGRFRSLRAAHLGILNSDQNKLGEWSWERWMFRLLMPAEPIRERRILNGLEQAYRVSFSRLGPLIRDLSTSWQAEMTATTPTLPAARSVRWLVPSPSRIDGMVANLPTIRGPAADLIARTPRLGMAQPSETSFDQELPIHQYLAHVKYQRALLTLAATRAFELDHQRPPTSSAELVSEYLPQRPVFVHTGEDLLELSRQPDRPSTSGTPAGATIQPAMRPPALAAFFRLVNLPIPKMGKPFPFISFNGPPQL